MESYGLTLVLTKYLKRNFGEMHFWLSMKTVRVVLYSIYLGVFVYIENVNMYVCV